MNVRTKTALATPKKSETDLAPSLVAFFDRFGELDKRVNRSLNVAAALVEVERLVEDHPKDAEVLGILVSRLHEFAQRHTSKRSEETEQTLRRLSEAGSGSASNRILRYHYFELYDITRAVREEMELSPSLQSVWSKAFPAYVEGLLNGAFAAHDLQQALILAGARITPEGFEYEIYDGPRREDVERGLASAAQVMGTFGSLFPGGRYAQYADRHFSCDGAWCDFGENNAKWRVISRGRPVCSPVGEDLSQCRFPWRFNMQLDTRAFGGIGNPYQRLMTGMNSAEWYPGSATFRKAGGRWEMVGAPTLHNPN